MKKIFLMLCTLFAIISCGIDNTPAKQWANVSTKMQQELKRNFPDMGKLKELDKEMTDIVKANKDYVLTDHDRNLLTNSIKQTFPLVYKLSHNIPDSFKWDDMARAFNNSDEVRKAINGVKTLGEFEEINFDRLFRDIMEENDLY